MTMRFDYEIPLASILPSPISKIVALLLLYAAAFCFRRIWKLRDSHTHLRTPLHFARKLTFIPSAVKPTAKESGFQELEFYKSLFFRLQNVEHNPEVLPLARQGIMFLISEALSEYTKRDSHSSILSMETFNKEELSQFLQKHQKDVTDRYAQYITQRKLGGPRQLVRDRHEAELWLRKIAPLKLVDGAWLGQMNKITLPFALRPIMKKTWQVFTEELGDGNIDQHHVYIYEDLLRTFEPELPSPTTKEILHPRWNFSCIRYWRAAVAQLMIARFSEDFFPEILGFTMHFEMLQLDTMQAAKELPEVGLDPYYFILHVSIDNSHSGHAAMSMECVVDYVQKISELEGKEAAHTAWRRIQAGYILSEWLGSEGIRTADIPLKLDSIPCDQLESRVGKIFRAKAQAAQGIHAGCKANIGNRSIDDWLSPNSLLDEEWQQNFLQALTTSKPWIYPGDSNKSRLVKELRWGGKMFGTFTREELTTLQRWIDSLKPHRIPFYFEFVGLSQAAHCQGCSNSNTPQAIFGSSNSTDPTDEIAPLPQLPPLSIQREFSAGDLDLSRLLPLWFTQCSLLESFVYAPGRTADPMGCAVVRLLRAQLGFEIEHTVVTGINESHTEEDNGIVGIGLEMVKRASLPVPPDLMTLLARWPSKFADKMLQLSSKPLQNLSLLLGISAALIELQGVIAEAPSAGLLSLESCVHLQVLFRRQYHYSQECKQLISTDGGLLMEYSHGYAMAKAEIGACVKVNMQK
ncbi:hypothetical protein N7516_011101 [Penicillium verrucosum]|uniref:uncharacterized protein n=1 Tax=Penicillium verrucosum TaxID=60171 RepID=UPI0025451617|nr:uncharacterized protein N7516_011101 [Penicillium verrucosum]KAJ5920243.1 hypothetical protein N7516_011101 [Penicillium verrucosum]